MNFRWMGPPRARLNQNAERLFFYFNQSGGTWKFQLSLQILEAFFAGFLKYRDDLPSKISSGILS